MQVERVYRVYKVQRGKRKGMRKKRVGRGRVEKRKSSMSRV